MKNHLKIDLMSVKKQFFSGADFDIFFYDFFNNYFKLKCLKKNKYRQINWL